MGKSVYGQIIANSLADVGGGKQEGDSVSHPSHYTIGKIETIDYIEDKNFNYHLGNAIKYISRCEHKGRKVEDLKKAIWYLNREIKNSEVENDKL